MNCLDSQQVYSVINPVINLLIESRTYFTTMLCSNRIREHPHVSCEILRLKRLEISKMAGFGEHTREGARSDLKVSAEA